MKEIAESEIKICRENFLDVYTVGSEIGRGKFAVVKRCIHKQTGLDYAAKFIHKRRKGKDCRQAALREIQMLNVAVVHPRIVDIVEVYENTHEIIIVTEYARGGELFNHIDLNGKLDEKCVIRLMGQILDGLAFLHQQNILHMDIKPQNILLTEPLPNGDIKLCDLGLARTFNCGEDLMEIIGTPDYVAPEVLDFEPLGAPCDMWSVGVLAYVMLTGCSPFAGDTNQETFLNISQVNLDFPEEIFSTISTSAISFIQGLLICDPRERMTAAESLNHCWLNEDTNNIHLLENTSLETPPVVESPFPQRRMIPHSPEPNSDPIKKCRCDESVSAALQTDNREDVKLKFMEEPESHKFVEESESHTTSMSSRKDSSSIVISDCNKQDNSEFCVTLQINIDSPVRQASSETPVRASGLLAPSFELFESKSMVPENSPTQPPVSKDASSKCSPFNYVQQKIAEYEQMNKPHVRCVDRTVEAGLAETTQIWV